MALLWHDHVGVLLARGGPQFLQRQLPSLWRTQGVVLDSSHALEAV